MSDSAQSAAAGLLDELAEFVEDADEATDEVEQTQEETVELDIPDLDIQIPDDITQLLESPDDDDDEEDALVPVAEELDEYDEDPEKAALVKKLKKLNKRLEWEQEQRLKNGRKLWSEEARKYFQFSNPEVIQADSRRSFLKQAQSQHDAVAKIAKPVFEKMKAERDKIRQEEETRARKNAEDRWGRTPSGPSIQATENTETRSRERLQQGRNLTDVIKEKMKRGEVNI